MICRYISLFLLCFTPLSFAAVGAAHVNERDLYFGEAFYYAYQGKYVDAITRQDITFARFYGPDKHNNPDPLHFQFGDSRFSLGDFELSYRMHQRARRAFTAVIDSNVDQAIRNEAAYQLARISLQRDDPAEALRDIKRISGKVPESIREDELFLRAQIYMANGNFVDAIKTLRELNGAESYKGFAAYNLGVALIKTGQEKEGLEQLEKAGKISGDDDVSASIRDKANLALGYWMIDKQQPALAKRYLDRVRLSGPFSNKALLGSGWADVALGRFESALVPWTVLVKRNATDKSVQESMLGVPYAYAKLDLHGKAVSLYDRSLKQFERESTRLDASIKSVREGRFLQALMHLQQDDDLIARIKSLPETPETYYLVELMASNDFQDSLKNYLDLDDMLKRLESWDANNLKAISAALANPRQSASQNHQGYDEQIRQLRMRVHDTRQKVDALLTRQGQMLEVMAINEFSQRRKHLQEYQAQARFALAESYERAIKKQSPDSGVK